MALVVRLIDIVDREKLETGTSFGVGDQGELQVWDAANRCIAMFAAGRWTGVIEIPSRQPAKKEQPRGGGGFGLGTYHVYLDGQHLATRGDRS